MDRSEWVLVPRHYTENIAAAAALLEASKSVFDRREAAVLRKIEALMRTPPPPAEQASGEFDSWWAAQGVNAATSVTPYVIARRAWDAALSQRPVVTEAAIFAGADALCGQWNLHYPDAVRMSKLVLATAPQQPEKGEG